MTDDTFKDVQFKDVPMFGELYQYGHKYTEVSQTKVSSDRFGIAETTPDNWVQVKVDDDS